MGLYIERCLRECLHEQNTRYPTSANRSELLMWSMHDWKVVDALCGNVRSSRAILHASQFQICFVWTGRESASQKLTLFLQKRVGNHCK